MSLAVDCATFFLRETYHSIAPDVFPVVNYSKGRELNVENIRDDSSQTNQNQSSTSIFYINQIIYDSNGQAYRVIDLIGSGSYGSVFKCQMMTNPDIFVALKIIKNQPQFLQSGINEINIVSQISQLQSHPGLSHILIPLSTFEYNGHLCIVLPLLQQSLFNGINVGQSLESLLSSIRQILTQLLLALDAVHMSGIIHGDVKPENILKINDVGDDVCLIDFGNSSTSSNIGTYYQSRFYRSPEIVLGTQYNSQIDVWSAGCVAAELFLDFAIFSCDSEFDLIHTIVALIGQIPDEMLFNSMKWRNFFNFNGSTFTLKSNPVHVILNRHLNKSVFIEKGLMNLNQLILSRFDIQSKEEYEMVQLFSHFIHSLLVIDPSMRLTPRQALQHPFLTGAPLNKSLENITNFNVAQNSYNNTVLSNIENIQQSMRPRFPVQCAPRISYTQLINQRCPAFLEMF